MFDPSQKAANYEASDCYWRLTPIQSRNIPTYPVLLMSHFYWGMGQEIASVQLLDRLARGVNKSNIFSFFLGPRGPLITPLVPVPSVVPSSATKIHATSPYSFSDSKLILFHIQTLSSRNLSHSTLYTEH